MIVYYFDGNNVFTQQGEINTEGWPPTCTPTSPLPIPNGSYALWKGFEWEYIAGERPQYPTTTQIQEENKSTAQALLQETDWTCTVDITNPLYSNPYLTNQPDFLSYRSQVRAVAVNPPTTLVTFPSQPVATWSS